MSEGCPLTVGTTWEGQLPESCKTTCKVIGEALLGEGKGVRTEINTEEDIQKLRTVKAKSTGEEPQPMTLTPAEDVAIRRMDSTNSREFIKEEGFDPYWAEAAPGEELAVVDATYETRVAFTCPNN